MTDDHIAVKIDGVIYVKLDDVKPMRDRIEKLEAALREVLSWVNQYSVDATYDDHWPVIEERAHKALDAK